MSTSQTSWLTKPQGDDEVSRSTLAYLTARIRRRAWELVIAEFEKSGISQATLARRWRKAPEVVSRLLSRPGNWELNTLTEALFVINGAVPTFGTVYTEPHVIQPFPPCESKAGSSTGRLD